jgi:hypothetical protein
MRVAAFLSALVFAAATSSSSAAVIGFDQLPGPNNSPFTSYTEDGFRVFPAYGARWYQNTIYGSPAPAVMFNRNGNEPDVLGSIGVQAVGGFDFTFSAIDLYSSVTRIPHRFIGWNNSSVVFDFSATMGNTFGTFRTANNPFVDITIDLLIIELVNPFVSIGGNPMGVDNIVVSLSNAVPEPSAVTLALLCIGLVAAARRVAWRGALRTPRGERSALLYAA